MKANNINRMAKRVKVKANNSNQQRYAINKKRFLKGLHETPPPLIFS